MAEHDHAGHEHAPGHDSDQGFSGMWRYLRLAPRMWSSEVNDAVVDLVAPQPGELVVDIGAGMGPAAVRAASMGASVIAVEPTPFMRRVVATRRALSGQRKRIIVDNGSAEALPLDDHSADAVWAVNTMHHWVDPSRGAAEIARVLKPEGRIVLVDEDFADPSHPDAEEWKARHGDGDHHGFSRVDAAEMGDLLTDAGLTGVVAEHRELAGRPVIAVTAGAS